MFAGVWQTNTSKNFALAGISIGAILINLIKDARQYTPISADYKIIIGS
jgi:hypothetical protein